jgi:exopolysaccharide biosynthesis polyprenyl glycosylphosphotransferase
MAHAIRVLGKDAFGDVEIPPFSEFQWLLFVLVPFGPIILESFGFYEHPSRKNFSRTLSQMARSALVLAALIAGCAFFLRLTVPSRAVIPIFGILAASGLLIREQISLARYRRRIRQEANREKVLIVGSKRDMQDFRNGLTPEQRAEFEFVQEFDVEVAQIPQFVESLHLHSVGRVLFTGTHSELGRLNDFIVACEVEGVEAWLIADFIRTSIARPEFDAFAGRPVLVFRTAPSTSWSLLVKAMIDRTGALIGICLFSWLYLLIAIAVRLESKGPIIFSQKRGGKNGRPFTMYKFRTMVTDAEMQREELAKFNEVSGPTFKLTNDPRVTRVGKFLRKTSLDEIPQLFNVLRGDMSLVGPRPLPLYEVERFETTAQRRRLSMKPGLTCLWQISGRSNITDFKRWVELDLEYIDNWSVLLDLKILLKTVPVVLFGSGAK